MIHNFRRLTKARFIASIAFGILTISVNSHLAFAKDNDFEKVTENGKTVYKKKAGSISSKKNNAQKVKVDMYLSTGCSKCVSMITTTLAYDTIFLRKFIDKKSRFKKELIKLSGDTKTPAMFINGKKIQNLSPAVIEFELRKAGAKLKPPIKSTETLKE